MQQGQANCVKYLCQRTQTNCKTDFEICIFPRIETRKSIKLHVVYVYFICLFDQQEQSRPSSFCTQRSLPTAPSA